MTVDSRTKMVSLAESFPTVRGILEVWDPERLDRWATGPRVAGSGGFHSARFLLGVWNDQGDWKCGRFDFHAAYNTWDRDHQAAFVRWASEPWWP